MSDTHTILCGLCNAPVSTRVESDPDGQFGCAACDNWADKEQVMQIAADFLNDKEQLALNRMARDIARDSSFMTFEGQTTNDKRYRFIAVTEL